MWHRVHDRVGAARHLIGDKASACVPIAQTADFVTGGKSHNSGIEEEQGLQGLPAVHDMSCKRRDRGYRQWDKDRNVPANEYRSYGVENQSSRGGGEER